MSFQKGDFIQLVHTVDDNWLEAQIDGNEGIIPRNYVKVASAHMQSEYTLDMHVRTNSSGTGVDDAAV